MVVLRAQQALAAMATSEAPRADMHEFRNALADLCALTFPDQDVNAAVTQAVEESEYYAEIAFGDGSALAGADSRQRCHDRVWNALQQVIVSLVDAKPSSVASALGRTW